MDKSSCLPAVEQVIPNRFACPPAAAAHYQDKQAARRFAAATPGTATDRREKQCLARALAALNVPAGASVLDCPCGAGRMFPLLKQYGYRVTGADISPAMLEEARRYAGSGGLDCLDQNDRLLLADIFHTQFDDKCFDLVLCNRLFQYFSDPQTRRAALGELKRISAGPIIVSFLCNRSVDSLARRIRIALGVSRKRKCPSISPKTFADDIHASGLQIRQWILARPLISERWYVLLS